MAGIFEHGCEPATSRLASYEIEFHTTADSQQAGCTVPTLCVALVRRDGTKTERQPINNEYQYGAHKENLRRGNVDRYIFQTDDIAQDDLEGIEISMPEGEKGTMRDWHLDHVRLVNFRHHNRSWRATRHDWMRDNGGTCVRLNVDAGNPFAYEDPLPEGTLLGPCVSVVGMARDKWHYSIMFVYEADAPFASGPVIFDGVSYSPDRTIELLGRRVVYYTVEAQLKSSGTYVSYKTPDGRAFEIHTPAVDACPAMTYASCNGVSAASRLPRLYWDLPTQHSLWKYLSAQCKEDNTDVLLMGGDQVYTDPLWGLSLLRPWVALSNEEDKKEAEQKRTAPFTTAMRDQLALFLFDLHCRRWSYPAMRAAFASLPVLCMWDDHDIFDGWGSYPAAMQASPVFQGIFGVARDFFEYFQLKIPPGTRAREIFVQHHKVQKQLPRPGDFLTYGDKRTSGSSMETRGTVLRDNYTCIFRCGRVAIVNLDLRGERALSHVMTMDSWDATWRSLEAAGPWDGVEHVMVMSSVPVLWARFSAMEKMLELARVYGVGRHNLEDDLRDHWTSEGNSIERQLMIEKFLGLATRLGCRVTFLSGDVHVGGRGVIYRKSSKNHTLVNQFVSSGICALGPPELLNRIAEQEWKERGVYNKMLGFEEKERKYSRYLYARNYLTLTPSVAAGHGPAVTYEARWYVEGETDRPYTKRILPPGSWASSASEFMQAEEYSDAGWIQRCCFACMGGDNKVTPSDG